MPELVKLLDLEDTVVTADALNCQYEIANAIIEKKGNYVLAVKGNKKNFMLLSWKFQKSTCIW